MLGRLYEDVRSEYNYYRAGRTQHYHLIDVDTALSF